MTAYRSVSHNSNKYLTSFMEGDIKVSDQQFTFQEHDKLNRKPFAEFLFSLIQHRNEYRRPDSNQSYSIAIDAVYGSGKTRFLKMFQSMLRQDGQYNVAYYSAWEHDLYDDALAPILSLLDRPAGVFEDQAYERMEATLGSKALHVLKRMGTSFLSMKAKKHFGEDYEEIIDDIKDLFNGESSEPDAYDLRMKCIDELQKGLAKATEDAPLVFIIDELDRCNPAFAIKTLEVAKHLLDIENVIFIFALDMQQMRAAVRKFYGQDIDADGYLCKVFDYMTLLPLPEIANYVMEYLCTLDSHIQSEYKRFCSFAVGLLQSNCCSLRFIDTLFSAYRVMWHSFLRDYDSNNAYCLYLFALFLKFQHPDIFLETTRSADIPREQRNRIYELANKQGEVLGYINSCTKQIDETAKYLKDKEHQYNFRTIEISGEHEVILRNDGVSHRHNMYPGMSINGVLFFKDLSQYEQIKHLTFGQFIHRQLEMYNPIRTEETTNTPTS